MQEELLKQILSEIKELKSDVSELKSDVTELKAGQKVLEEGQQRLELKLDAAYKKIAENSEGITDLKYKFSQQAKFIGSLNNRVGILENIQIGADG